MHAPESVVEKYDGVYDEGYDPIRKFRYENAIKQGVLESKWKMSPPVKNWEKFEHKEWDIRCMEVYAAMVDRMDEGIGRIVKAIEDAGAMENTIIVFWSDHGYFLGEKGLWYKRKAFERSARMPLIISVPGMSQNQHTNKPVELVDLYPTLADLCDLEAPANLEGQSLRPLLDDPETTTWTKPAVTQVWHNQIGRAHV